MNIAAIIQKHVRDRFVTRKEIKANSIQNWSWLPKMSSELEFKSGVYAVFFWSDSREKWYFYIGQSQNLGSRLKWHCATDKKSFPNRKYKNIATKYGSSVRVRVLESCSVDDMSKAEGKWMKRASKYLDPQMMLNSRLDNVETNRGVSNEWIKGQWANNPEYRKKMRKALRQGSKTTAKRLKTDKEMKRRYVANARKLTEDREALRRSSPYEQAKMTMASSKSHGIEYPVSVSGWCFASYTHLAKAMRCSRRVAKTGWESGELYELKIERITWKRYLAFFENAKSFECKELRKPMSNSEAASSLWSGIGGTAQPLVALSPSGQKFYFRGKKPCAASLKMKPIMIDRSVESSVPFAGWKFKFLTREQASKHLDKMNPDLNINLSYSELQKRTKDFLKEVRQ